MHAVTVRPGTGAKAALTWDKGFTFRPGSVPLARAQVRHTVSAWGFDAELVGNAELVVSELAANAVLHGRAPGWKLFTVRLAAGPHGLTVEVDDGSPLLPVPGRGGEDDETGRGLWLVAAVSKRWGVALRPGAGKRTWALLEAPLPARREAGRRVTPRDEVATC